MYRILDTIFTSRTRVHLLLTFFSNVRNTGFLRRMAEEFGESTNSVHTELLRLADAGLILSRDIGRRRYYRANPRHPLYPELRNLAQKALGLDDIRQILAKCRDVQLVLVIGAYSRGRDSGTIELMIVGREKKPDMDGIIAQAEEASGRSVRPFLFSEKQFLELRRSLPLDDVLVLRDVEGAADKLLEAYRDPRWDGDAQWKSDIRWSADTCLEIPSPFDCTPEPQLKPVQSESAPDAGQHSQRHPGQSESVNDAGQHSQRHPVQSDSAPDAGRHPQRHPGQSDSVNDAEQRLQRHPGKPGTAPGPHTHRFF